MYRNILQHYHSVTPIVLKENESWNCFFHSQHQHRMTLSTKPPLLQRQVIRSAHILQSPLEVKLIFYTDLRLSNRKLAPMHMASSKPREKKKKKKTKNKTNKKTACIACSTSKKKEGIPEGCQNRPVQVRGQAGRD